MNPYVRRMWEESAAEKVVKPKDILSCQGNYDMKHGPNGDQKSTLDPKEQAARAVRAERAARKAVVTHPAYKPPTRTGLPETAAAAAASRAARIAELRKRNQK